MKIVLAPDSFKGNQSAMAVGKAMERGIKRFNNDIETIIVPMADGGEGTVESTASTTDGAIKTCTVHGPLMEKITAEYCILEKEQTAVIEMAAASGLPLVPMDKRNPELTSTLGTGELIKDALNNGCRKIILGIGGSSTTDGGIGAAYALGVRFYDKDGNETGISGSDMEKVVNIDISNLDPRIKETEILTACDVNNPFYGKNGAAYVYGPQKGADKKQVKRLDEGLRSLAGAIEKNLNKKIDDLPGAGAAGGLGGGLVAFLDAKLQSGVELIIETVHLNEALQDADLVITGEGKTDFQTAFGKVPAGVAMAAKRKGIPVVCFSGALGKNIEALHDIGITALFSTANREMTLEYAIQNSLTLLEQGAENIVRLFYSRN